MLIRIRIGETERDYSDVTESWIVHQIKERQQAGHTFCVQLIIKGDGLDMILSTPGCGGGGGGRQPNSREQIILDLWIARHLTLDSWEIGNLIAFLRQFNTRF
jgi:hypothetical protein